MKDNNFVNLGKRIREKRLSRNLTQEALAEKADVGTTHISHIETGCTKLSLTTFISIANALNMPPLGFAMIIGLGASCAFMMPVGTPPNAIVYSTGFVKQSEMIRVGKFIDLTCMLIIGTIAYLFWM